MILPLQQDLTVIFKTSRRLHGPSITSVFFLPKKSSSDIVRERERERRAEGERRKWCSCSASAGDPQHPPLRRRRARRWCRRPHRTHEALARVSLSPRRGPDALSALSTAMTKASSGWTRRLSPPFSSSRALLALSPFAAAPAKARASSSTRCSLCPSCRLLAPLVLSLDELFFFFFPSWVDLDGYSLNKRW